MSLSPDVGSVVAALATCLLLAGCSMSRLARHTVAFSTAAGVVIDHSEDAYRAANRLRYDEQVALAVDTYGQPGWRPDQELPPLLSASALAARLKVLNGLKLYAATLVELTGKPGGKDIDAAADNAGGSLKDLDKTVTTVFKDALGGPQVMTTIDANGIKTAVVALQGYLIHRRLKRSLPAVTNQMNGDVQALCELIDRDLVILRREEETSYASLETTQNHFLDHQEKNLTAVQHREEVARLLELAAEQRETSGALDALGKAVQTLAMTHQALSDAAQGHNPQALRDSISDLAAAGQELGSYYSSLPTK